MRNKKSIAVLLGDPSGIGPELISKILSHNILKKINIIIIGEKSIFDQHLTIQKNRKNIKFIKVDLNIKNLKNFTKFLFERL